MAFLIRMGLREGFAPWEIAALALASALVFIAPLVGFPVGSLAVLLVASVIGHRAIAGLLNAAPGLV